MANLRDTLTDIYRENGTLTPALVVDIARDPGHPLHNRFEWDDTVAAEKYRQVQAGELIRAVKVTEATGDDTDVRVRAFHSVPRPDGTTYVPVEEVREDDFTRQLVIKAAEREWRQLHARYRHLTEFLNAVKADISA